MSLAVALSYNDYDYINEPNYISATSILKPLKAIVIGLNSKARGEPDVLDFVASRVGTAIHTASEDSWLNGNYKSSMRKLGYPEDIIARIKVNPTDIHEADIPVYLERRSIKELAGYKVGGKFDAVMEGAIRDIKTVKAFSYIKNDMEPYRLQLSIYRWLNQDIITSDVGYVDMIITDWKKFEADMKPEYPQLPVVEKKIRLMTITETENWLTSRLNSISSLVSKPQSALPLCSKEELWADPTKYKYFKNPAGKRATKVFDSMVEANQRLIDEGSVGIVKTVEGTPKRCNYCVKAECEQAQNYILQGVLEE